MYLVFCDHGSPGGRRSWDPMLALMAIIGDENKAGYDVVSGRASVNPETGENHFEKARDGNHKYVVKKMPAEYYKNIINELIEK